MTGTQIINAALEDLGVIEAGGTPASADSTLGLSHLNRLIDAWAAEQRFVFYESIAAYEFSTSAQSYTIGPSGTSASFTAARPVKILRANVIIVASTPDLHIPLRVYNTDDYASLALPAQSADYPHSLYYQPTLSKGTLWPYPYPTVTTNKLELVTWNQLAEISSAGTEYPLPPGYRDAIIRTLAESLAKPFGVSLDEDYHRLARNARASIAVLNSKPPTIDTCLYGARRGYDITTGGF